MYSKSLGVYWSTDEPSEDGLYLTTLVVGAKDVYVVICQYCDGKWQTSGEVKAWMNLPSPYEEEV